ncbi:hypothetical protein ACQPW3_22270 [Actinosynnema sp. CA-248983]
MLLRLAYLDVTNAFALPRLSERDENAEILALRHQITTCRNGRSDERASSTASLRNCSRYFDLLDTEGILSQTAAWDQGVRFKGTTSDRSTDRTAGLHVDTPPTTPQRSDQQVRTHSVVTAIEAARPTLGSPQAGSARPVVGGERRENVVMSTSVAPY